MSTQTINRWLKAGIAVLMSVALGIMLLMTSCEPEPESDGDGHHRDSPSTLKRY